MNEDGLKNLAEQKEKEWREIQEKRIDVLEKTLKQKCQEMNEEKCKFSRLKEDFKYNLKLLEERDADLEKYEQTLLTTRKQLSDKNAEVSDLKIKIDELKVRKEKEKGAVDECKKYYLNRLNQKQNEVDKYKGLKDAEINQERAEIEKYKRTLKRELQDLQIDLETQRYEMKTEFDEILRKREHEWRLQTEEVSTRELAKELQIKMLTNELSQLKERTSSLKTYTDDAESSLKSVERKLKETEWELKDSIVLKDARIQELEAKIAEMQMKAKSANEDLNRKNDEMDRRIREKDMCMEKLKLSNTDLERKMTFLEEQIAEYKSQIKSYATGTKGGNETEKDKEILELNEEIIRLRSEVNRELECKAKKTVEMDIAVEELKQTNEDLNSSVYRFRDEIESLKSKVAENVRKLDELEAEKKELNADWQNKYHLLESMKAKDSEQFNMQILESRNEALAKIKTLEDQLRHKENVIGALQTADPSMNLLEFESNEFQLKEENTKLKQIIKQMREEMENIASNPEEIMVPTKDSPVAAKPAQFVEPVINADKVIKNAIGEFEQDLARQLQETKQKNRQLQSQLDEYLLAVKAPENLTDSTIINSHIKSLNETISILRKEKMDLTALCKKQQAKLLHIEKSSTEIADQMRLKQTQIETLQYEMNSQARRSTTEITNLKQTLANSELELSATRREADEYHKATIEKSSEISALEAKISELKLKLSTSGTELNFGAKELFIQQLQDEIKRLSGLNTQLQIKARQQHHQAMREQQSEFCENESSMPSINDIMKSKEIDGLKSKLKKAAKFISHLIQEKEHLIEMSNQLRGELNRIKYDNDSLSLVRINRNVADDSQAHQASVNAKNVALSPAYKSALTSQLQQLERKQYELTKQQLAFAQKKEMAKSEPSLNKEYKGAKYKESESTSDDVNTVASSVRSDHMSDIWRIIDEHEANPVFESGEDPFGSAMKVTALKPKRSTTPNTKSPRHVQKSANNKLESKIQKPKIRNYNDRS